MWILGFKPTSKKELGHHHQYQSLLVNPSNFLEVTEQIAAVIVYKI